MNNRYTIEKEVKFCCAHRLNGHEGQCKNLHGHNYRVIVRIESKELDPVGRVIDFSQIKEHIKKWIDDNWDHAFVYNHFDVIANRIVDACDGLKRFAMSTNPTAENMARHLLGEFSEMKWPIEYRKKIQVTKVTVYETDEACASCECEFKK